MKTLGNVKNSFTRGEREEKTVSRWEHSPKKYMKFFTKSGGGEEGRGFLEGSHFEEIEISKKAQNLEIARRLNRK